MPRILITGSRHWSDRRVVRRALEQALAELAPTADRSTVTVVHGAARGADSIAAQEAHDLGCRVKPWRANWGVHGKAAGPLRNQAMVDAGADVCLAFPLGASIGTPDCIGRAEAAGIPVRAHEPLVVEDRRPDQRWPPVSPRRPSSTVTTSVDGPRHGQKPTHHRLDGTKETT